MEKNKKEKTDSQADTQAHIQAHIQTHIQTRLITSGRGEDESSLPPVLYPATAFENPSLAEANRMSSDPNETRLYARYGNPTVDAFQKAMAELEGAEKSRAFSSGSGAVATLILGLCETGDHIVAQSQLYAGTVSFLRFVAERLGIEVSFIDGMSSGAFVEAVNKKTRLIFVETPANPQLGIVDLSELAEIKGPIKVVDSTLAPPVVQTPLKFGVDLSLHSATKSIGGQNDATLGVLSGSAELLNWLWTPSVLLGANAAPSEAYKGLVGIRTLGVRQERQCASALKLAKWLEGNSLVESVSYPSLEAHPQYELAKKQMSSGGSLICFDIKDPEINSRASKFFDCVKLAKLASSLGGPETLVTGPAFTTHVDLTEEEMKEAGISKGTVRVSLGLEHVDDIIADFEQALSAIK